MKKDWITHSFTEALIREAKKNKKIILLDADLADDANLKEFKKNFPGRFIQNGIAEQDMVSMAGGIALTGLIPVVNSFASFLTSRANEQIYNNCTELTKIIYICLYAGILPAGAGKSHQSLRDVSLLSSIPNFRVFHPSNANEVKKILKYCINKEKNSCAIRLNLGPPLKDNFKIIDKKFQIGKGTILNNGNKIALFTYGQTMTSVSFKLNKLLLKKNIKIKIINLPCLNYFDQDWLKKCLKNIKHIIFLDDHHSNGGMADMLTSFIVNKKIGKNLNFHKLCITDYPACGLFDEVLKFHNLDEKTLHKKIKKIYQNEY